MSIRRSTVDDLQRCQMLVRELADHFTEDVPDKIAHDLPAHGGWAMTDGDEVLGSLQADGVELVEAKTLDAAAGYEPYVGTRVFWERRGFVHIDTIDPLPGWQAGSPAAIYVCALGDTPP